MNEAEIDRLVETGAALATYTVYENPRDFLGRWIVRRFVTIRGNAEPIADREPLAVTGSIESARAAIKKSCPGAVRFPRAPEDDPCIVEVWI